MHLKSTMIRKIRIKIFTATHLPATHCFPVLTELISLEVMHKVCFYGFLVFLVGCSGSDKPMEQGSFSAEKSKQINANEYIEKEPSTIQGTGLFSSPLLFYGSDILKFLRVYWKAGMYKEMYPFFCANSDYGKVPLRRVIGLPEFESKMKSMPNFGYDFELAIPRTIDGTSWELAYDIDQLPMKKTVRINAYLVDDTTRIDLQEFLDFQRNVHSGYLP
jgi:hypothetical protein